MADSQFFKSTDVKIFPASFRGNWENNIAINAEARMPSEYNLIHSGSLLFGHDSFVTEYKNNTLKCVIGGYYFEITNINTYNLQNKYLCIKLRQWTVTESDNDRDINRITWILDRIDRSTTPTPTSEDSYILDCNDAQPGDTADYRFHGLAINETTPTGISAYLKPFDSAGNIRPETFLPFGTICAGKGTAADNRVNSIIFGISEADTSNSTKNEANSNGSFAHGYMAIANGEYSHAEGYVTNAEKYAHAEGVGDTDKGAYGEGSHTEGYKTKTKTTSGSETGGKYAHAEGYETEVNVQAAHAEGYRTTANGRYSHAEGYQVITGDATDLNKGYGAHAEGCYTKAYGDYSHAEGSDTTAEGIGAHAEGRGEVDNTSGITTIVGGYAKGDYSHSEGYKTKALGAYSHAEGFCTIADEDYSHAEGKCTVATGYGQTVVGRYNTGDNNALFIVGNGDIDDNNIEHRGNALVVKPEITQIYKELKVIEGDKQYLDINSSNTQLYSDSILLQGLSASRNEHLKIVENNIELKLNNAANGRGYLTIQKNNARTTATLDANTINLTTEAYTLNSNITLLNNVTDNSKKDLNLTADNLKFTGKTDIIGQTDITGKASVSDLLEAKSNLTVTGLTKTDNLDVTTNIALSAFNEQKLTKKISGTSGYQTDISLLVANSSAVNFGYQIDSKPLTLTQGDLNLYGTEINLYSADSIKFSTDGYIDDKNTVKDTNLSIVPGLGLYTTLPDYATTLTKHLFTIKHENNNAEVSAELVCSNHTPEAFIFRVEDPSKVESCPIIFRQSYKAGSGIGTNDDDPLVIGKQGDVTIGKLFVEECFGVGPKNRMALARNEIWSDDRVKILGNNNDTYFTIKKDNCNVETSGNLRVGGELKVETLNITTGNINVQNGSITATSFYATSDSRLKENIVRYNNKKSILDLPIYKYKFKNSSVDQIGCMAQDLQEICPELVKEDNTGYLTIQENKLVYLLLDEVKKLKKEIKKLKK